ncbi:MAG TPA: sigma factor, partial [Sphingopyxis sp.]|nr:sigma factor [Sphingopyxis sp.]
MRRRRHHHGLDLIVRPERVEAALWRHSLGNFTAARSELFSHYVRFAQTIARDRFLARRPSNYDLADVEQLAYEGLLHAIDRFEPLRPVPFRAFARPRIAG